MVKISYLTLLLQQTGEAEGYIFDNLYGVRYHLFRIFCELSQWSVQEEAFLNIYIAFLHWAPVKD